MPAGATPRSRECTIYRLYGWDRNRRSSSTASLVRVWPRRRHVVLAVGLGVLTLERPVLGFGLDYCGLVLYRPHDVAIDAAQERQERIVLSS